MEGKRTSLLQIVSISFTFYTKLENFTVHQCQKLLWYQSEGSQIDNRTQLRKMTKCGKTTPSTYNVKKLTKTILLRHPNCIFCDELLGQLQLYTRASDTFNLPLITFYDIRYQISNYFFQQQKKKKFYF